MTHATSTPSPRLIYCVPSEDPFAGYRLLRGERRDEVKDYDIPTRGDVSTANNGSTKKASSSLGSMSELNATLIDEHYPPLPGAQPTAADKSPWSSGGTAGGIKKEQHRNHSNNKKSEATASKANQAQDAASVTSGVSITSGLVTNTNDQKKQQKSEQRKGKLKKELLNLAFQVKR